MIRIENISKNFGDLKALDNVSLSIKPGEIFGLLGPNGAGKSTTINIISTVLQSDSGKIFFEDKLLSDNVNFCKGQIGIVPQEISLYEELSAFDNLKFWGDLYSINKAELNSIIEEVLKLVGLFDRKDDKIKTYSGGMKRRINIAASILHKPKILLMDEPTVGIDPQSRNRIFEVVEELNKNGMTIIYTTHYMEEAERLCNRIAIIDVGKIIALGTLDELKKSGNALDLIKIEFNEPAEKIISKLKSNDNYKITADDNFLKIHCHNMGKMLPGIISEINSNEIEIAGIESHSASLETVFLNLTGKQLRD